MRHRRLIINRKQRTENNFEEAASSKEAGASKKTSKGYRGPRKTFVLLLWSERPRSLLLSLGGAIQTLALVLSWARPGPIPSPRWSRPDSPCALFYSVSDPSRFRGGGHPGPSWSHPAPERSLQDRAWTGRSRLLGHFRYGSLAFYELSRASHDSSG